MTLFYSVWDLQTNNYMATGSNSKTKHEAMVDIFNYLAQDFSMGKEEEKELRETLMNDDKELEAYINDFEFEIHEHEGKINYDK